MAEGPTDPAAPLSGIEVVCTGDVFACGAFGFVGLVPPGRGDRAGPGFWVTVPRCSELFLAAGCWPLPETSSSAEIARATSARPAGTASLIHLFWGGVASSTVWASRTRGTEGGSPGAGGSPGCSPAGGAMGPWPLRVSSCCSSCPADRCSPESTVFSKAISLESAVVSKNSSESVGSSRDTPLIRAVAPAGASSSEPTVLR